jgi:hypothetical protein
MKDTLTVGSLCPRSLITCWAHFFGAFHAIFLLSFPVRTTKLEVHLENVTLDVDVHAP